MHYYTLHFTCNKETSFNNQNFQVYKQSFMTLLNMFLMYGIFINGNLINFIAPKSSFTFLKKNKLLVYLLLNLVQERLTKQIAVALTEAIQPAGVGVVIEATYGLYCISEWKSNHFCSVVFNELNLNNDKWINEDTFGKYFISSFHLLKKVLSNNTNLIKQ